MKKKHRSAPFNKDLDKRAVNSLIQSADQVCLLNLVGGQFRDYVNEITISEAEDAPVIAARPEFVLRLEQGTKHKQAMQAGRV